MHAVATLAILHATAHTSPTPPLQNTSVVDIDLLKFLGLQSYFAGVSWDPFSCMPPYKTVWPNIDDETIKLAVDKVADVGQG